jgi:hypothetical protein
MFVRRPGRASASLVSSYGARGGSRCGRRSGARHHPPGNGSRGRTAPSRPLPNPFIHFGATLAPWPSLTSTRICFRHQRSDPDGKTASSARVSRIEPFSTYHSESQARSDNKALADCDEHHSGQIFTSVLMRCRTADIGGASVAILRYLSTSKREDDTGFIETLSHHSIPGILPLAALPRAPPFSSSCRAPWCATARAPSALARAGCPNEKDPGCYRS